jgi:hypothetical protein
MTPTAPDGTTAYDGVCRIATGLNFRSADFSATARFGNLQGLPEKAALTPTSQSNTFVAFLYGWNAASRNPMLGSRS